MVKLQTYLLALLFAVLIILSVKTYEAYGLEKTQRSIYIKIGSKTNTVRVIGYNPDGSRFLFRELSVSRGQKFYIVPGKK